MAKTKYHFSGYATKNDLQCTDGRTIKQDAFKHQDGQKVPLVWQHDHSGPANVLGYAVLEHRKDGVYTYGMFNESEYGKQAKELVEHGDITDLSIHANQLKQQGKDVLHGNIREVSLVMAGANPGAFIDNLEVLHGDSYIADLSDAILYTADTDRISLTEVEHEDKTETIEHKDAPATGEGSKTMKEVFETLTDPQKTVVYAMLAHALGEEAGDDSDGKMNHSDEGGKEMKKNVFEGKDESTGKNVLSHAQFQVILQDAQKNGSFKESVLAHATEYGIENIDVLFPDAKSLSSDPDWLKREDDWVQGVLAAIHKSPFSRVKSIMMNMDIETARAKGYVKATEKKEVYLKAAKRVTTPHTIYVKQKLDRDDIIDVTDFNIIDMVRKELRILLDEELAVAALVGDGRELSDDNHIPEENIRPIWKDDELYAIHEELTTKTDYKAMIKQIAFSNKRYKGSGSPVLYTTSEHHTGMLWVEDTTGRRIYESDATLCAALGVNSIKEITALESKVRILEDDSERELIAIKVNLRDYNFGADNGGQVASFEDFDIDFNQMKYLLETRCSGALTKPKSAQIYEFETKAPVAG